VCDMIEKTIELLETAYAEKDWEFVLDAIRLLNEIPDGNLPSEEDEETKNNQNN